MRLLLDTHLLVWIAEDSNRLPAELKRLLRDEAVELFFSPASIWEVSIKQRQGRSDFDVPPLLLHEALLESGYVELPIGSAHGAAAGNLPLIHRDPFDRIMIAQATVENIVLATADRIVARYPGPIRKF